VNIYNTTASLGKYFGDYFVWVRDYHYTPKASDLIELGATRYFTEKKSFVTIKGVFGRAPDIADLAPLNQIIVLKTYGLSLNGQIPLTKSIVGKAGVGYMHQRFPSDRIRNISDINAGLYWQF
jgi:YaiO family outer membrane protein